MRLKNKPLVYFIIFFVLIYLFVILYSEYDYRHRRIYCHESVEGIALLKKTEHLFYNFISKNKKIPKDIDEVLEYTKNSSKNNKELEYYYYSFLGNINKLGKKLTIKKFNNLENYKTRDTESVCIASRLILIYSIRKDIINNKPYAFYQIGVLNQNIRLLEQVMEFHIPLFGKETDRI